MAIPYLEIDAGAERKRFEIPEGQGPAELILGRAPDCQIVIPSAAVSRRHARLRRLDEGLVIEDLGSSNGTFVNGEKISTPKGLKDGDRISFGTVELVFVAPPPPEPPPDATIAILPGAEGATVAVPPRKPKVDDGTIAIPMHPSEPESPEPPAPPPAAPPLPPVVARSETVVRPPPTGGPPSDFGSAEKPGQPEARRTESTSFSPPPRPADFTLVRKPPAAAPPAQAAPKREAPSSIVTDERTGPSVLQLCLIAIGSFVVTFAIGAVLVRYVL